MATSENSKLVLPSIVASRLVDPARNILISLLLLEIGQSYQTSIGITNQINIASSFLAIITAIIMGALSVKFDNKKLLIIGIILTVVSIIGCVYSNSFIFFIIAFALGGIGITMTAPMATTILGVVIPVEKRAQSLRWLFAAPVALFGLGYPIVNMIGDWRQGFLYFTLPITLGALILSSIGIPSSSIVYTDSDFLSGYRTIFSNRSASASLLGHGLGISVLSVMSSLGASYFRSQFSIERGVVIYIIIVFSLANVIGAFFSNSLISRIGYKRSMVFSTVFQGFAMFVLFTVGNQVVAVLYGLLTAFLSGLFMTCSQGLNLGQIPEVRGSMMSMVSGFSSTGRLIGLALSGWLLIVLGWSLMSLIISLFGLISGIIVLTHVNEPVTSTIE